MSGGGGNETTAPKNLHEGRGEGGWVRQREKATLSPSSFPPWMETVSIQSLREREGAHLAPAAAQEENKPKFECIC